MEDFDFPAKVVEIQRNLSRVREAIARAAKKGGRDPEGVQLVGVTKTLPQEIIRAGAAAGITCFGENYPEQAADKIRALDDLENIEWHMIGHIQSRKTRTVCTYFNRVHSVDRLKIARYLNRYCGEADRVMPVLLEVNISGEESKYGWQAWREDRWDRLLVPFEEILALPQLDVQGLMSMPPLYEDPEATRPHYQHLRRLQAYLQRHLRQVDWEVLSIGTSFDYEVAVEEGATIVRIGTALFGERPAS